MPTLHTCPDDAGLQALAAGDASADDRDQFGQHLETCPGCAARLDALAGSSDLTDLLRTQAEPVPVDEAMLAMIDRLAGLASAYATNAQGYSTLTVDRGDTP